uniref:Transmembrane protein n=3 Tax=Bursaphelenchus xylophilus TaxID=6326 RepID=A0A1I7RWP4_BURXY
MLNILGEDVNATLKQHDALGIQYTLAVRYHARPKNWKTVDEIGMYRETCRTSKLYWEDAEVYGFAGLAVALYIAGILMLFMSFLIILEDLLLKLRRLKKAKEERKKAAKAPEFEKMEAVTQDMDRPSQMSEHRPSNSELYSPHRGEHGSDNEQASPGEPNSVTGREHSGNSKGEST